MPNDFLPVHLIQTFVAFIEAANITEAADKLGISQPAVSVHLKKLEEMLPHSVFHMQGKRKVLSAYGRALYESLSPAFHQMQQNISSINSRFNPHEVRTIKVGGPAEVLWRLPFRKKFTGTLQLMEIDEEQAWEKLRTRSLDVAILSRSFTDIGFTSRRILEEQPQLCVHSSLCEKKTDIRRPDWLMQTPYISCGESPPYINEWLSAQGVTAGKIRPRYIANSWQTVLQLVQQGSGYSILPFSVKENGGDIINFPLPSHLIPSNKLFAHYAPSAGESVVDLLFDFSTDKI